jgi:hypothetical protein
LGQLLERKIKTKIVCISDYGKRLLERYFSREEAYKKGFIKGWVENKDGKAIAQILTTL